MDWPGVISTAERRGALLFLTSAQEGLRPLDSRSQQEPGVTRPESRLDTLSRCHFRLSSRYRDRQEVWRRKRVEAETIFLQAVQQGKSEPRQRRKF